jgi:NADPH:quinone reductase-like Zn-dependent oxidoreductase
MCRAAVLNSTGPEVLKLETGQVGKPVPGEAPVRHSYVAVNFIDVYITAPGNIRCNCPTVRTRLALSKRSDRK